MEIAGKKRTVRRKQFRMVENRNVQKCISVCLSLAGALCLPRMQSDVGGDRLWGGILVFLLFCLSCPLIDGGLWKYNTNGRDRRSCICAAFFSGGLVLACLLGRQLEINGSVDFGDGLLWLSFPVLTTFFTVLSLRAWDALDYASRKPAAKAAFFGKRNRILNKMRRIPAGYRLAAVFAFLFLCWFIILLGVYPGFFVYDAQDEYVQVAARNFTTHHPLTHVALLGGIISLVNKLTGSFNLGIAAYMIFQMLIMAGCFTYVIAFLGKRNAPVWLQGMSILYFALFPVIQMYVLCSAKDTLYSAAMLLVTVMLAEQLWDAAAFWGTWVRPLLFTAALCGMAVFRHNGFYILVLLTPSLWFWAKRKGRKRSVACAAVALALYFGVNFFWTALLHPAQTTERQEMLTVPIQQLTRAYKYKPELFTGEQIKTLHQILPEEALQRYNPKVSDAVKADFDNEAFGKDAGAYLRLWLEIGLKCPAVYLNAWFMTSYGFWYPDAVIDVYRGNQVFTFTYGDSSYFGYETELPGVRDSKIPWLDNWFRELSLNVSFQKIPVVSMLFSPGFLFWLYFFCAMYLISRRSMDAAFCLLPVGLNWLTVLLGPTYLVRYVVIFWFALPALPVLLRLKERKRCAML